MPTLSSLAGLVLLPSISTLISITALLAPKLSWAQVGSQLIDVDPARPAANGISGRELFERHWQPMDVHAHGDGLGPLFNATSCIECHFQGGIGGAGPNDKNVQLFGVHWDRVPPDRIAHAREVARQLHPSLNSFPSLVLHHEALHDDFEVWRLRALGLKHAKDKLTNKDRLRFNKELESRRMKGGAIDFYSTRKVPFVATQRNTPPLFGTGLIDSIPEKEIKKLAEEQRGNELGISGRVPIANPELDNPIGVSAFSPRASGEKVGRFGWKGQTATLTEFVAAACANELGLQTPNHPQFDWRVDVMVAIPSGSRDDLTEDQCRALISFVQSLDRPPANRDPRHAEQSRGEQIFNFVGCVHCHVRQVAGIDEIYSDLLLHDLGAELADPIPANLSAELRRSVPALNELSAPQLITGYYAPPAIVIESRNRALFEQAKVVFKELSREWKTPPLWGLADSAPYLHDGRAATIHDAVSMHGGEAAKVRDRYLKLDGGSRNDLLDFLASLAGPRN